MKIIFAFFVLITLSACQVGDFPPERNAQYESKVDCQKTPNRCIHGYPW